MLKGEADGREAAGRHPRTDCCAKWKSSACLATFRAPIDVDVSDLVFGKVLRVEDLPKSDKLKFLTDANQPVAHVTTVKEEVVATPEAVAAEAGAAPAEPEVIKKGKQEVEGEEGEAAAKPEKAEKTERRSKEQVAQSSVVRRQVLVIAAAKMATGLRLKAKG